jgi:hypothetical protein
MTLEERLLARSIPEPNSGCLFWTGAIFPGGLRYGKIKIDTRYRRVHRVAWEIWCGAIPEGMNVLHRCDMLVGLKNTTERHRNFISGAIFLIGVICLAVVCVWREKQ